MTDEELANYKSKNVVDDVPENFKKWVTDNADRIEKANNRGTLPYFLKDNATFAGISVKDINLGNRAEYTRKARAKFDSYDSSKWSKEYFDEISGGFNVYHIDHEFSESGGGGDAEKVVGKLLAKYNGKQVEFLPEGGKKKPDLLFDEYTWEVKYIDIANEQGIRNHFKDARKADNVIFYFTNDRLTDLNTAIKREIGRFAKEDRIKELPDVYYMDNELLKLLWKNEKK